MKKGLITLMTVLILACAAHRVVSQAPRLSVKNVKPSSTMVGTSSARPLIAAPQSRLCVLPSEAQSIIRTLRTRQRQTAREIFNYIVEGNWGKPGHQIKSKEY